MKVEISLEQYEFLKNRTEISRLENELKRVKEDYHRLQTEMVNSDRVFLFQEKPYRMGVIMQSMTKEEFKKKYIKDTTPWYKKIFK